MTDLQKRLAFLHVIAYALVDTSFKTSIDNDHKSGELLISDGEFQATIHTDDLEYLDELEGR